jgi:ketosteroid isomerase-like protein
MARDVMGPPACGILTPVSEENVDIVKGIFDAWSRGDFSSPEWADPEIEFSIPGPDSKVHKGIEAAGRAWLEFLSAFSDLSIEAREIRDAGDQVVVHQIFHGQGRGSGIPLGDMPAGALFTLRDGKAIRFQGFVTFEDALDAAGLEN